MRDVESVMLVRLLQEEKAWLPIDLTPVGIVTDVIEQDSKALLPIDVIVVDMTMAPLQHAPDGSYLLTQSAVVTSVGDAVGTLSIETG